VGKRVVITGSGLADANDEAVIGYAPRHGGEIRSSRRHCVAIGYSTQNANNRTSFDSVPTLQDKVVLLQGWRAQLKQAMPAMRVNKVQIMGKQPWRRFHLRGGSFEIPTCTVSSPIYP